MSTHYKLLYLLAVVGFAVGRYELYPMAQGRNNSEYSNIQADKADTSETKTGEIFAEEETDTNSSDDVEEDTSDNKDKDPTQYEATVTVNVRSEADQNSEKSGYFSPDDIVTGTEEISSNWIRFIELLTGLIQVQNWLGIQ